MKLSVSKNLAGLQTEVVFVVSGAPSRGPQTSRGPVFWIQCVSQMRVLILELREEKRQWGTDTLRWPSSQNAVQKWPM